VAAVAVVAVAVEMTAKALIFGAVFDMLLDSSDSDNAIATRKTHGNIRGSEGSQDSSEATRGNRDNKKGDPTTEAATRPEIGDRSHRNKERTKREALNTQNGNHNINSIRAGRTSQEMPSQAALSILVVVAVAVAAALSAALVASATTEGVAVADGAETAQGAREIWLVDTAVVAYRPSWSRFSSTCRISSDCWSKASRLADVVWMTWTISY
jgi:hypothetical protein